MGRVLALVVLAVFVVIAAVVFSNKGSQQKCEDCNVVWIVVDAMRADRLGVYGYQRPTSPNTDAFAKGSFVFESAYSDAATTEPSLFSAFTDLYPTIKYYQLSDFLDFSEIMNERITGKYTTLAEVLKQANYSTATFMANTGVIQELGFMKGFDTYVPLETPGKFSQETPKEMQSVNKDVLQFLSQNRDKKFFAYIHYIDTHAPYSDAEPYFSMFMNDTNSTLDIRYKTEADLMKLNLKQDDWKLIQDAYDGDVRAADAKIGEVIRELDNLNLTRKTIVIITADHGEELGERGAIGHGIHLNEESIRIPLIVKVPNVSGQNYSKPAELIDVAPTILNLLNIPIPQQFQGQNLFLSEKKFAFTMKPSVYSLASKDTQFIFDNTTDKNQYFDLNKDPMEKNDLVGTANDSILEKIIIDKINSDRNFGKQFEVAPLQSDIRADYSERLVATINESTVESISTNPDLIFDSNATVNDYYTNPIYVRNIPQNETNKFYGNGVYISEVFDSQQAWKGIVYLHPVAVDAPRVLLRDFDLNNSYYAVVVDGANIANYLNRTVTCPCADSIMQVNITDRGTGQNTTIFETVVNAKDGWKKWAIDASDFAGKKITLVVAGIAGGPCGMNCGEFTAVDKTYLMELSQKPININDALRMNLKKLGYAT